MNQDVGLVDEMFEDEDEGPFLARLIHDELEAGRHAELEFNMYSVRIDPDAGSVTVTDVFGYTEFGTIADLRTALGGRPIDPPHPPPPLGIPLGPNAGD